MSIIMSIIIFAREGPPIIMFEGFFWGAHGASNAIGGPIIMSIIIFLLLRIQVAHLRAPRGSRRASAGGEAQPAGWVGDEIDQRWLELASDPATIQRHVADPLERV